MSSFEKKPLNYGTDFSLQLFREVAKRLPPNSSLAVPKDREDARLISSADVVRGLKTVHKWVRKRPSHNPDFTLILENGKLYTPVEIADMLLELTFAALPTKNASPPSDMIAHLTECAIHRINYLALVGAFVFHLQSGQDFEELVVHVKAKMMAWYAIQEFHLHTGTTFFPRVTDEAAEMLTAMLAPMSRQELEDFMEHCWQASGGKPPRVITADVVAGWIASYLNKHPTAQYDIN